MLFHESFLVAKMSCYKNFTFFNKIKTATEGGETSGITTRCEENANYKQHR